MYIKLETIVKYFDGFVGNFENGDVRRYTLDIFVDKVYIYKVKMLITFHFTDDRQELSYEETLKMIENDERLMGFFTDPNKRMVGEPIIDEMWYSLLDQGGENPDFFQRGVRPLMILFH